MSVPQEDPPPLLLYFLQSVTAVAETIRGAGSACFYADLGLFRTRAECQVAGGRALAATWDPPAPWGIRCLDYSVLSLSAL